MERESERGMDSETASSDPWSVVDPDTLPFHCHQAPATLAAEPAVQIIGVSLSLAEVLHGVPT